MAKEILPFILLGLDTDNGSEFINYELLKFCEDSEITFTRSRAYRKNDQAHVEEKNGSIVRRLIGYDRYEGLEAQQALIELYAVLRLYVNFFQPSLKLDSKERHGGKVVKKYKQAQTPYQRLLNTPGFSDERKGRLTKQYNKLDPVFLLKEIEKLQNKFWEYAWQPTKEAVTSSVLLDCVDGKENLDQKITSISDKEVQQTVRRYRSTKREKASTMPRNWRTHPDPFENVWEKLRLRLELKPSLTAKNLLDELIKEHPRKFSYRQLRTLQRSVAKWRKEQIEKSKNQLLNVKKDSKIEEVNNYVDLAMAN